VTAASSVDPAAVRHKTRQIYYVSSADKSDAVADFSFTCSLKSNALGWNTSLIGGFYRETCSHFRQPSHPHVPDAFRLNRWSVLLAQLCCACLWIAGIGYIITYKRQGNVGKQMKSIL